MPLGKSRKKSKRELRSTHPMQVAVWTIQFLGGLVAIIRALAEHGRWV